MKLCHNRLGSALLGALAATLLLVALGAAVLTSMLQGLYMTRHVEDSHLAFNLAESGVDRGARWLKDQPSPPAGTSTITPFSGTLALGDGTYTVQVIPDAGNSGAILKAYKVRATGTIYGQTERVDVVVRQQSFGRYAYFTDTELSAVSGGRIWFFSGDRIRGPAHSNNTSGNNFQINWAGSTAPIFEDIVTAAGPSMTYSPSNPNTESQFLQIYRDGSRGYRVGVDPIPMPNSSDIQKTAAWGVGAPSTANGVHVNASGGIYIVGDSTVALSTSGSNQIFTIVQGANTWTVTADPSAGTRTVRLNANAPTTVSGAGSGVLFSTGHITSLSGTIADNITTTSPAAIVNRNAYTIAADINAGKNITVTNNIRYTSQPNPSLPINDIVNLRPGTLGLMARNVTVASTAPQNLDINAVILAGSQSVSNGSFGVANYSTKTPTGTLKIVGGIIQKARGAVGTFNAGTGTIVTGYAKNYIYDPRLADYPPPYFPTTGLYDTLSWQKYRA